MSTLKRIAKEIISHIDMTDPLVRQRVEKEINVIAHTDGVYGENNLENFYRIWQKHKNEKGNENLSNSWLAYYLGLTTKEPDSDEITDRRVYARASFPDIDTDFDCFYQEFIFDYLAEKYGNDFVGRTGTYQGLKMRASLTRIIKALDLANAFHLGPKEFKTQNVQKVDEILKNIPRPKGTQAVKVKDENGKLVTIKTVADAYKYFKDFAFYMDKYPEVMQHANNIEGLLSSFGQHPAGICLSNIPLYELCPFRPAKKGESQGYVTQFVYEDLELLGLIKFDILAISTLAAIDRTLKAIKTNYGIDIDAEHMDFEDEKTFKLFREGNLIGVFQCESWGMQETMKSIHVDRFEDIVAALALYRPGPMDSIPEYAARKLGHKPVDYFHPSIEPFVKPYLSTTYGILCIHEDTLISMGDGTEKKIKYVKKDDRIVCIDDNSFTQIRKCLGCMPTKKEHGIEIELDNGYKITLTKDHKVLTWKGMKRVDELDIDKDIIACPEFKVSHVSKSRPLVSWLGKDEDVAFLLGMLMGDGDLVSSQTSLCLGGNEDRADTICKWINDTFPNLKINKYFSCRSWYVTITSDILSDWRGKNVGNRKTKWHYLLENLDIKKKCYDKRIPNEIFKSSVNVRSAFLAGYLESDGCIVNKDIHTISANICSINNNMLEDIRNLCQGLEIVCTINRKDHKVYIYNLQRMYLLIKDFMLTKDVYTGYKGKTLGWVPSNEIIDIYKKNNISIRRFSRKYNRPRLNIEKIIKDKNKLFVDADYGRSFGIFKGDLRFYRIKSVKKTDISQFYDISVDEYHNLVGNGIVISNCFQEQVMQVFESLANIPKTDAYELIKGIGKKQSDLIEKFKQRFIDGCKGNKIPEGIATSYWENFITPFASYGFNLAHAECYAVNAYICAYLKAHYPEEYMISLLNVENFRKKHDKIETFEKDLKRSNMKLSNKNINKCGVEYRLIKKRDINAGITHSEISPTIMVKGVGYNAAVEIEKNQPYTSLRELAEKTDSQAVDQDSIGSLFDAGFFDEYRKKYKQKNKQTITRDMFVQKFSDMRKDLKKVSNSGKKSEDLFGRYR